MIWSQNIKPGMRLLPAGSPIPYTVLSVEYVHGYTGKYIVTARDDYGSVRKFTFWAGERVSEA